ncbi:hypothetical protein Tco_0140465 [Tanacetum coccineum]
MVLNSPCFTVKSWLVQDQTVPGKDKSNLLMSDSLLKQLWISMHQCYGNEALTSPKANALEFKNHLSDNKESLGEDASKQGRIDDAEAEVTFIDETSNDARNKNNKISNSN